MFGAVGSGRAGGWSRVAGAAPGQPNDDSAEKFGGGLQRDCRAAGLAPGGGKVEAGRSGDLDRIRSARTRGDLKPSGGGCAHSVGDSDWYEGLALWGTWTYQSKDAEGGQLS